VPFNILLGYIGLGVKTVSAPNFEQNYGWFKTQEMAMKQVLAQICNSVSEINQFKLDNGGNMSAWTQTVHQQYGDLLFAKDGFVQKYNSLVSDYDARRSNFIQSFGRDVTPPDEVVQFYDANCTGG